MTHTTDQTDPAEAKKRAQREEQATIYAHLQTVLEEGENLLGFTRGRIAGGFQGKLFIGIESFFVPDVNIGLTDKRLILQHLNREQNKPSRNQPHSFPLAEVVNISFIEADAFHNIEELGRLSIQLLDEQACRLRLDGAGNCEQAKEIVEVFHSLVASKRQKPLSPTQKTCAECERIIDQPVRFCPYCGVKLEMQDPVTPEPAAEAPPVATEEAPVAEAGAESVTEVTEEVVSVESTAVEVEVEVVSEVVVESSAVKEVVVDTPVVPEQEGADSTPAPNPDAINSWDAYAQRVIAEQTALRPEGGN
jgi:hypothetical protein